MAIVSSAVGVCDDSGGKIRGVFPTQIQGRWEGVLNIAGGTKVLANDRLVRFLAPFGKLFLGIISLLRCVILPRLL